MSHLPTAEKLDRWEHSRRFLLPSCPSTCPLFCLGPHLRAGSAMVDLIPYPRHKRYTAYTGSRTGHDKRPVGNQYAIRNLDRYLFCFVPRWLDLQFLDQLFHRPGNGLCYRLFPAHHIADVVTGVGFAPDRFAKARSEDFEVSH